MIDKPYKAGLKDSILTLAQAYADAQERYTIAAMQHPAGAAAFYDDHDLTAPYRLALANAFQAVSDTLEEVLHPTPSMFPVPTRSAHSEDALAHGSRGRTFQLLDQRGTKAGLATWKQLRASLRTEEGWIDPHGEPSEYSTPDAVFVEGDPDELRAALAAHDAVVMGGAR